MMQRYGSLYNFGIGRLLSVPRPRTHRSPSAPNTGFRGFDLTILDGTMKLRRATNPGVSRGIRHVGEEANKP